MEKFQLSVCSFKATNSLNVYLCHCQAGKCLKLQEKVERIFEHALPVATRKRTASPRDSGSIETFGESGIVSLNDATIIRLRQMSTD